MSFIRKLFKFSDKKKSSVESTKSSTKVQSTSITSHNQPVNKTAHSIDSLAVSTYSISQPIPINQKQSNNQSTKQPDAILTTSSPINFEENSSLKKSTIKSTITATFSPIVKTMKPKEQTKIKKLIKDDPKIDVLETIKHAYKELIDDSDCVFKMCNHQYLIIMQKTPDTRTNEARQDVADPKCAKFRANILNVILIINVLDGKIVDTINITDIESMVGEATIGQPLESERFDNNLSLYSYGIYYYNSIEPAFYRRCVPENYTGQWIKYHDNGNRSTRAHYVDGKKEGTWWHWEEAGYLSYKETYLNDKENGDWISWCGDTKICKGVYVDGKRQGVWTYWKLDKTKHYEIFYIDDREDHVIKFNNSSTKLNGIVKKKIE